MRSVNVTRGTAVVIRGTVVVMQGTVDVMQGTVIVMREIPHSMQRPWPTVL